MTAVSAFWSCMCQDVCRFITTLSNEALNSILLSQNKVVWLTYLRARLSQNLELMRLCCSRPQTHNSMWTALPGTEFHSPSCQAYYQLRPCWHMCQIAPCMFAGNPSQDQSAPTGTQHACWLLYHAYASSFREILQTAGYAAKHLRRAMKPSLRIWQLLCFGVQNRTLCNDVSLLWLDKILCEMTMSPQLKTSDHALIDDQSRKFLPRIVC